MESFVKFLKSISLFCFFLGCGFFLGMFCFFYYERHIKPERNIHLQEENLILEEEKPVDNQKDQTTCDTLYIVKEYINGVQNSQKKESIPFYFMGLSRDELEKAVNEYEKSPSFSDLEKGFQSIRLVSYAPDSITVEKYYENVPKEECYYLRVENNKIVVYQSDQETIFMTTDLVMEELPGDLQQDIIHVKCFNNLESLYDFLESHTS